MALTLADAYGVTVVAAASMNQAKVRSVILPDLPIHSLPRARRMMLLASRRYQKLLWNDELLTLGDELRRERFDLVVCHDLDLLPLAAAVSQTGSLVFDAREYYPRHFEDRLSWRLLYRPMNQDLCRDYLPQCDLVLTVSDGLSAEYERVFGVKPMVVPSLPPLHQLQPSPVDPERIRMVHHGWANRSRRLENMIRMMDHMDDRFTLDLMLVPLEDRYDEMLRREAEGRRNVNIVPPVPYEELIPTTNAYDIGVFLCSPTTFNLRHALPNKLFEFIQARLAVAIGPSPEMQSVVDRHGCGVVSEDFEPRSLSATLNELSAQTIEDMKSRSHTAARQLNASANRDLVLGLVEEVMEGRRQASDAPRAPGMGAATR